MKNLITYLKTLWRRVADSQSSDVRHDYRRSDLRRSPSGLDAKWKQNPFMRFAVVLTLIFTIGSGNAWGADETLTITGASSGHNAPWGTSYGSSTGSSTTSASHSISLSWTNVGRMNTGIQIKANTSNHFRSTSYPSTNNIIKSIKITMKTNTANLYGSTDGSNWTSISYTSGTAKDVEASGYKYFKVSATSSYCVLTSIVVTYTSASGYSITYHCNGATSGCPSNASGQSALPNPLPTPSKTGFTFGGWYTDEDFETGASAGATLSANADLYAKWTCNVTLNRDGATETINNIVEGTALDDIDGTGAQGGCSAWTFVGWSKTQRAAQNESTPMTLVTEVDGAGPYYAVYSHTEGGGGSSTVTDVISASDLAATSTSYTNFSSVSKTSDAVYAGQSSKNGSDIQLRGTSPAGIVSTTSGGTVKSVVIEWSSSATASRTVDVYGNSSAYSTAADLYNSSTDGDKVGSITYTSSSNYQTTYNFSSDYEYVGIRMTSSATRISSVSITWTTSGGGTTYYSTTATCCTDPELNYAAGSVTKTFGDAVFTNALTNSHSVAVTYSSSDPTVATVNGSGQVTILKVGSTTITASSIAQTVSTIDYCADEASYTLTVNKADITPTLTYTPSSVAAGSSTSAPTVGGNTGGGGVTYAITSATPAGCATIDAGTGVVSGVAVGSVTVTATVAATTNYNGGSATANVTITAASYFTNGATVFVQTGSVSSAWDASACVKAWFNASGAGGAAQTTYWLYDGTGDNNGKKLFATIVPTTGDLNQVTLQRFDSNCSDFWNNNGTLTKASDGGSNTFRTEGSGTSAVAWNASGVALYLYGDPNSWESSLATFSDQLNGVWKATYNNYAPANVAGESQDFKIFTSYNDWIGSTGSNNNATLDGMHVGSTYNITATLDVKDHSLTMSKTFVKGTVHFNLQGHGSAISDLTNVAASSKISAPGTPSATGYDFGGWYKEPACTNAWNFGSDVVNETMTLYAKWTVHEYTITKTLTNVTSSPVIPSTYTYTGAAAGLTYEITPSDGYRLPTTITVTGTTHTWDPATGALVLTGTITNNVTITISAVQTHTVDWYVGGSAPANKIGDDGQTTVVDHGGKISAFPATTPDGSPCDKTFVGWTNTSSYEHGTSPLFNDVAGSPTINADASFYAVFAEVNSVSASLTKMTADDDLEVGDKIVIIAQDTRYGMYQASASSYVSYWTTTDMDGEPSLSEIEADDKKYLDVAAGSASNTWKLGDATNGYLYNASSTNLEFSTTNSSDLTLITWTDDSFTLQAGQYISCRTDITGANANKWRGAGASCDPENDNNCSGTEYYYLYKYVPGGTTYTGHTINCADCGTSVTVSYSAPGSGNTMAVTKNAAAVASGSTVKTCTSQDLTVTLTPATHYDLTGFTATGLTTGTATITPAVGSTLPVSVAQTFTVTVSAGATGTLTLAPTFTAQTPLSITLETHSKGTFTPIGDVYSGESFTFPTVTPSDAECSSFLGWIEGTMWSGDGTETDPTAITGLVNYHAAGSSSGTLTTTKTYTAVFGEKDTQVIPAYQKVTSAPSNWSGDYLIVRDANSRAFDGSLSTLDAADNYIGVTISEGSITANSTVNASKWTIAKVGATSNYTIKSASGYYIGRTASSNGLNSSTSEAYTNTLSYSDDHVVITSSGSPTLQMNSGTRFRYYTTSQQALQLYKYNPDAEVVSYTYTTNPACTPRYRVTISSATGGSPEADKTYEHADETITITANPAAGYSFTSWTITKTTGGDNVTSTLLTGDKPTTANTTFTMPAYDITIAATYTKKMVSTLEVKDGATVISTTTGPVSGTINVSTGANKTLDVVITPSDAFDHSWTATVSAGSTYASITNVTDDGFRVNGLAQGDATITVNAPNDGSAKSVTLTVHVTDIMPEEIILKREGSDTPIETLTMYYDASESKGQYVKVNVSYSPANPTNKAFTFSSAATGKVGSHSHAPSNGYEVLVANGVTTDPVNCTFTSSADGSVTKVLAVTVLPILEDRFVDYVHGNATQTVSARLSVDRFSIITDINTPSLSDASDADPTSEDCETAHYHLVGWLPQATAEALMAAGTPITEATEGLVRAGDAVEATGQIWCAIWAKEQ